MKLRALFGFITTSILMIGMFVFSYAKVNGNSVVTPGSEGDPLVSKSYVDNKFNQLISSIGVGAGSTSGSASQAFEPVNALAGQIVVGGEGAEIILRSGKGTGYITGTDGLVDVTNGMEIFNDYEINKNHLILVPRNDGRGVKVTEDAWFIIKGDYYIMN